MKHLFPVLAACLLLQACSQNRAQDGIGIVDRADTAKAEQPISFEAVSGDFQNDSWSGVTSMIVTVSGKTEIEIYADGAAPTDMHDIRSATKSITAILVGELFEDGLLASTDQPVAELLPARFSDLTSDDPKRDMTVSDLLTMRTGLACDDWVPASVGHEDKMYETDDWVGFLLSHPVAHDPGQHFSYCTGGVVLLGELIETLSGQSVTEFSAARLFGPAGITSAKWAKTPTGGTDTGGHLELTASDLHRIGTLVHDNPGEIIAPDWLSEMTGYKTDVYERRSTYGYLWWRDTVEIDGQTIDYHYAHGNGGNFVFIVPALDLVASFTGTNYGSRLQFQPVMILRDRIIPAALSSQARE